MRVSVVQQAAAPRRYTAVPGAPVQQSGQRWCYRQSSPTIARPAPPVVRQRRATVATTTAPVSQEAGAGWEGSPERRGQALRRAQGRRSEATPCWEVSPERRGLGSSRRGLSRHLEAQPRPVPPRMIEPELELSTRMPAPLPTIWRDRYELCPEAPALGGGAFAEVFKVRHRRTQQCFAVKVMHRPNFALRGIEKQIEAEISAMRLAADAADAAHDEQSEGHIVRLLDVAEEYDYVFLMLELCEQGDLLRKLHLEPMQRFAEEAGAVWARQLLLGLQTLHRLGYLHRDIKPDNLLCTDRSILKIADFGWCSASREAPTCLAGTFQYMAPEVLQNRPQTEAVDVWSAGVALHQMLVGKPLLTTYLGPGATQLTDCDPHRATHVKQYRLLEEISATCPPSYDRRPADLSPLCWDFLRQLLIPEAHLRITVDAALRHPWLAAPVSRSTAPAPAAREVSTDEPEETGPRRGRDRGEVTEAPQSPQRTRAQDPRSPSTGRASVNSIDNVPTPLKPRSWDPHRNIAYTPPMEIQTERDNSTPEVSPERKARLLMSSDRVSTYNTSPKPKERLLLSSDRISTFNVSPKERLLMSADRVSACNLSPKETLPERVQPARVPLSRLSPPAPPPRASQPNRRPWCGITSRPSPTNPCESPPEAVEVGATGCSATARTHPRCAPLPTSRIDTHAANALLRKLHTCNEQLRQIQSAMLHTDRRFKEDAKTLVRSTTALDVSMDTGFLNAYAGRRTPMARGDSDLATPVEPMVLQDMEPVASGFDVLTATAPPQVGMGTATPGVLAPVRTLDCSLRHSAEGLQTARGRENMLPPNMAVPSASPSTPWKGKQIVRNGVVCYTAPTRYATPASPLKDITSARQAEPRQAPSKVSAGPPPPASARISSSGPQQGQHVLLKVPTPAKATPTVQAQATVWAQPGGAPQLRPSGITRRRASAPSAWVQAGVATAG